MRAHGYIHRATDSSGVTRVVIQRVPGEMANGGGTPTFLASIRPWKPGSGTRLVRALIRSPGTSPGNSPCGRC